MIDYFIESTIVLAILYLIYVAALRKERSYSFNRYYLMLSVLMGVMVYFVSIPIEISAATELPDIISVSEVPAAQFHLEEEDTSASSSVPLSTSGISYETILIFFYLIGVLLMLSKALNGLYRIQKYKKESKLSLSEGLKIYYHESVLTPFSFFKSVFLPAKMEGQVPDEVLIHEKVHVNSRHSVDILLIEILKVVCWFQPFVYLFEKSIRQNHEYDADEKVIKKCQDPGRYFHMVLDFSGRVNHTLVSTFSFQSVKSRIDMLSKTSNKTQNKMKQILATISVAVVFTATSCEFQQSGDLNSIEDLKTVIIDLVHGGKDLGGITENGTKEKDIVLKVGQFVKKHFERTEHVNVILTRETDEYAEFPDRTSQTENADLLISIHTELFSDPETKQILTVYSEKNAFSETSHELAREFARELTHLDGDECENFVGYGNYYVLVNAHCPAAYVNIGNLANSEVESYLTSKQGQKETAEKLSKVITRYLAANK